jgi:hypothetical protein
MALVTSWWGLLVRQVLVLRQENKLIQFNGAAENGLYVDDTRTAAGTDTAIIFGRGATITGSITTTLTTTAYVTSSDQRLKENITDEKEQTKWKIKSQHKKSHNTTAPQWTL